MNQENRQERRAAARQFIKSLDQLEATLATPGGRIDASSVEFNQRLAQMRRRQAETTFTMAELEDAVADIEQFLHDD